VAIYVEMPFGGILVEEDFLDIPVGNWLYKPDELKSNRIPISGDIHW
jgi:hypothetical protein